MSSLSISGSSASIPIDQWITPKEQLERLVKPIVQKSLCKLQKQARESLNKNGDDYEIFPVDAMVDLIIDRTVQSKMWRSDNKEPLSLTDICVKSLVGPGFHILTNWYKARVLLGALPKKVPPLPDNMLQIINEECMISEKGKKKDGTSYTVAETHFLQLYCQEDESLNKFEANVRDYGAIHYPEGSNPLQFRYFFPSAQEKHGTIPFGPTDWVFITKDPLLGSRNKSSAVQDEMIASIRKKTLVNYVVPSLSMVPALFLHYVATGERLYAIGDEQNEYRSTYSRLQETSSIGWSLIVGGFAPSGLHVSSSNYVIPFIGVGAQRKFQDIEHRILDNCYQDIDFCSLFLTPAKPFFFKSKHC